MTFVVCKFSNRIICFGFNKHFHQINMISEFSFPYLLAIIYAQEYGIIIHSMYILDRAHKHRHIEFINAYLCLNLTISIGKDPHDCIRVIERNNIYIP